MRPQSDRDPPAGAPAALRLEVPRDLAGERLDVALARALPEYSRAALGRWIRAGHVTVDDRRPRARDRVAGGERVVVRVPAPEPPAWDAEALALAVVHEDPDLIVVDKPAGLVVHPGAGHPGGTLANALLARYPELEAVPRAGIVHRLDKDTSGLLAVARTARAHRALAAALKAREVRREYRALVWGRVEAAGRVEAPIGRHRTARVRMAVDRRGRPAATGYRPLEWFAEHTLLALRLETGRTHQIRVHMAHLGHPLVGDPVYGRARRPAGAGGPGAEAVAAFRRQALHAARLALAHPCGGPPIDLRSPLPADLAALLAALRAPGAEPGPGAGR